MTPSMSSPMSSLNSFEDAEIKEMGVLNNKELMVFDGKFWRIIGGSHFSPLVYQKVVDYLFDCWGGSNASIEIDLDDILKNEEEFFKERFISQVLNINSCIIRNEELLQNC